MDGCLTTLWVKRPPSVNQQGQQPIYTGYKR